MAKLQVELDKVELLKHAMTTSKEYAAARELDPAGFLDLFEKLYQKSVALLKK